MLSLSHLRVEDLALHHFSMISMIMEATEVHLSKSPSAIYIFDVKIILWSKT